METIGLKLETEVMGDGIRRKGLDHEIQPSLGGGSGQKLAAFAEVCAEIFPVDVVPPHETLENY